MQKSQRWMANFALSLMEQRYGRPKALVGCSHEHAPIRGRAKVDGVSVSLAEISGVYTPVQATLYARCVRREIDDWMRQGNKRKEAETDLKVLAQQAQGSSSLSREPNCEEQSEEGKSATKVAWSLQAGVKAVKSEDKAVKTESKDPSGTEPSHKNYKQFELRSGGVTIRIDDVYRRAAR